MNKGTTIWTIILFLTIGTGGCKQSVADSDLITIDVAGSHPEKELILQDFMEVEYIPLETNDEFLTQGSVRAISDKLIVATNFLHDGDIFFFDRKTGKGLRKINRKGQGAEEYVTVNGIVLDEEKNELFVNCASTNKILVYDLSGHFKRSLAHTEGTNYMFISNYDQDNLIRYDISGYYKEGEKREEDHSYHAIISKKDGSITRNISIPFDVIKAPSVQNEEGTAVTVLRPIIPYHADWLLVETSSDTIYNYISKENRLIPFLVKLPTDPKILLTMGTVTDRYYFMQTVEKVFDFATGRGFPITNLMYDKQENTLFEITVFNDDFVEKQGVDLASRPVNNTIASYQSIAANTIVEAYENNGLKGELKEIAATLDEESNPVIMLIKQKK